MASVNKAIIVGNLGRDPEMRTTQSGKAVCNFSVATTDTWTDQSGQRQESTEWHRIVAWGRLAEICGQYLHKGKQVYIEGRLQTRQWQDKDGGTRYTTEINAQTMQMLGRAGDAPTSSAPPQEREAAVAANGGGMVQEDDDLPF